jgi:signal peptidase I
MATWISIRHELAGELLSSAGRVRSVARGASMLPTIFPGDTLEIRSGRFDDVRVGDVVLTRNGDHLCTHRVVREEVQAGRRVLITAGDALPFEDPQPIRENQFLGRVDHIVRGGARFKPEAARAAWRFLLARVLRHSSRRGARFLRLCGLSGLTTRPVSSLSLTGGRRP